MARCKEQRRVIRVWSFYDAPESYRRLSEHGGDEDWLALLPKELANEFIPWLESGSSFGVCDVSRHALKDGRVVVIGAHS